MPRIIKTLQYMDTHYKHGNARYKIQYTSSTRRVDIDTGEQISEKTAKADYIKVQTHKKFNYNANRTKGHIEYTIEYRRQPQLRLF